MNRIRLHNNRYQVLITPEYKMSPDSSLLIGNWTDPSFNGFNIITFNNYQDAFKEAMKYQNIDWDRLYLSHTEIYKRLHKLLVEILNDSYLDADVQPKLMKPYQIKNAMMDRVNPKFTLYHDMNDIISFTIYTKYTDDVFNISAFIERFKFRYNNDVLRIRNKHIIDDHIIMLIGVTEQQTTYKILIMPSLFYGKNLGSKDVYDKLRKQQDIIDKNRNLA